MKPDYNDPMDIFDPRNFIRECIECGRMFDMLDNVDAEEWHYGHDCEN